MNNRIEDLLPKRFKMLVEFRRGNMEPLIDWIENSPDSFRSLNLNREDRKRLARALRTGSPLTRSEKRENSEACQHRDGYLICSVFYWIGAGLPGFSLTSENTAFHAAINDFEAEVSLHPKKEPFDKNLFRGAPFRTAESLYRHAWKPFVNRLNSGSATNSDFSLLFGGFIQFAFRGLTNSSPKPEEIRDRLQWFQTNFHVPGAGFLLSYNGLKRFRELLDLANIQGSEWKPYLHLTGARDRSDKIMGELFSD
ncbi:hypothetical protein [Marinobacter sp. DS40M6]|uniref:hypothetical protein n=1 Tax=Marinobacter sp. DS40M6 TaxID=1597776 RepID=UPI0023583973|nr:hypothetical protein [Marinobacter sp. DS40M6]MDC8454677.1 hypothetical protein [Marinobacter sp. DS40M6]